MHNLQLCLVCIQWPYIDVCESSNLLMDNSPHTLTSPLLYVGSSPLLVNPEENGMPLTIVVIDNSGRVAVTRGTIEIPTVPPPTTAPGSLIVAAWATYNSVVVDIVS